MGSPTCIIDVALTDSDGEGEREIMSNWFRFSGSNSSLPPPSSQAPAVSQSQYQGNPSVNFTAKREAERAAVQDSHIHHLRQQIENRLKVRTPTPPSHLLNHKLLLQSSFYLEQSDNLLL